jgi:DNA (cytosine-5)-methyltransferase 1
MKPYKVISMFSGCGGMDLGFKGGFEFLGSKFEKRNFEIVWSNDLNPFACKTYEHNLGHKIYVGSVWDHMDSLPQTCDVVIGGFPCQDISINGKRAGIDGSRSGLYRAMVEVVKRTKPKMFVAENVRGLLYKYNQSSLNQVISDFSTLGYDVTYKLYNSADYGVPQRRERVMIVGVLGNDVTFTPPKPTLKKETWICSEEAIFDLENTPRDEVSSHVWSLARKSSDQGGRVLDRFKAAHTVRAECHGNNQFHYMLPRRISMREAARFQSFPDNFRFLARLRETERMIGNAVPPILAWHIATAVEQTLEKINNKMLALAA